MTKKVFIGIDNGVSGTIGIITDKISLFVPTPVKVEQSYTKAKQNISRIEINQLREILLPIQPSLAFVLIERPMVNPTRFAASASALRALEATLNVIESLGFAYAYIDSKEWQKVLLPQGLKGDELKKASLDIGIRMFPQHSDLIKKHKDADGILIAEFCRRKHG